MKIRGTASTVFEKYQSLARDAMTSGDRIAAENYYQHAEHYYRVMQATKQQEGEQRDNRGRGQQNRGGRGNDANGDATAATAEEEKTVVTEEAAAEAASDAPDNAQEAEVIRTDVAADEAVEPVAIELDANGGDNEKTREAPMNPAELAAMSESGRKSRDTNGANGQGDDDAEAAEPAPRRQPRRRRRAQPEPEAATEVVAADVEESAAPVVEDVEPS